MELEFTTDLLGAKQFYYWMCGTRRRGRWLQRKPSGLHRLSTRNMKLKEFLRLALKNCHPESRSPGGRSAFWRSQSPLHLGWSGQNPEFFQRTRLSISTARLGVLTVENTLAISSWRFINIWWGKGKTLVWVWSCVTLISQHVRHMHQNVPSKITFSTEHWIKNKLLMEHECTKKEVSQSEIPTLSLAEYISRAFPEDRSCLM